MKLIVTAMLAGTVLFGASSKLDDKTGLIWQDNKDVGKIEKSQKDALKYCADLKVDGYSDWRVPTVKEYYTIVDLYRNRPALKNGFSQREGEWFWTSTNFAGDPKNYAWRISFSYGEVEAYRKDREHHIRCVRGNRSK